MTCKNCFHENSPEETTCTNCGMPLSEDEEILEQAEQPDTIEEAPVVEEAIEEVDALEEVTVEEIIEEVSEEIADEVNETIVEEAEEIIEETEEEIIEEECGEYEADKEEQATCKKLKLVSFSGLIALVIICIGLWIMFTGIFAPKYNTMPDRSDYDISYVKDNFLYQKPVSGKTKQVSNELLLDTSNYVSYNSLIAQSKDGKTTFFLENFDMSTYSGTLFVSYDGKTKDKIADRAVQGYTISEDGKVIMYMADVNVETAVGPLYYHKKGIEPQIIANNALFQSYEMSPKGKYIAFLENVDPYTGTGELYIVKTGSKPVKIDDAVNSIVQVSDKGKVSYLKLAQSDVYSFDLYTATSKKAPEFISGGIMENYVMGSIFSDKLAFVSTSDDQQKFNFSLKSGNKEPRLILEDLMGFFAVDIENENFLLAKMAEDASPSVSSPDMYLKKKGRNAINIAQQIVSPQHTLASYDMKTIYYLNNFDQATGCGTLNLRQETLFGAKNIVVAENVSSFASSKEDDVVIYSVTTDEAAGLGTIYSYKNGKTKLIAENVYASSCILSRNGKTVMYMTDLNTDTLVGTLYAARTTGSSAPKVIDTDVYSAFYTRSDKNALYLKNLNSETGSADLYIWKGRGVPELVDSTISGILFE